LIQQGIELGMCAVHIPGILGDGRTECDRVNAFFR
jgi:hypothetical protein